MEIKVLGKNNSYILLHIHVFLVDSLLVESGKTRNVLDNKGDDHVIAMEMDAGKQKISVEVISSKELIAVSVNGKNVSLN